MSNDAIDRLRDAAKNEQTVIGLSDLNRLKREEIAGLKLQRDQLLTALRDVLTFDSMSRDKVLRQKAFARARKLVAQFSED